MALDEEQSKRRTLRMAFTSIAAIAAAMAIASMVLHGYCLAGADPGLNMPWMHGLYLAAPLALFAPPIAFFLRQRGDTYTSPLRHSNLWLRRGALLLALYFLANLVVCAVLFEGGFPNTEKGIYWLGYPQKVLRLLSYEEYHYLKAVAWQVYSSGAAAAYYLLALFAWRFQKETSGGFRVITVRHEE